MLRNLNLSKEYQHVRKHSGCDGVLCTHISTVDWSTSIPGLAHSVLNFWVGITVISKHVSTSVKFVTLNLQESPLDDYSFHLFVLPEDGSIHGCISKLGLFCKLRR